MVTSIYLIAKILFIDQIFDLGKMVDIGTQHVFHSSGFFEKFCHGPWIFEHVIFSFLHVVKGFAEIIAQTDLNFQTSECAIIATNKIEVSTS